MAFSKFMQAVILRKEKNNDEMSHRAKQGWLD